MLKVTLRQLQIFATIARLGSVTLAAKQLHLTQSAASMALAELESMLGYALFERNHKRFSLTYQGQSILPKVITIIEQADRLSSSDDNHEFRGELRIAASSTIGNYILPTYFNHFYRQHPHVQIDTRITNTENIIQSLLNYEVDIGFIEGYCHHASLIVHPWLTDELCICVGKNHLLAQKSMITINDLAKAEWILREQGSGTRAVFEQAIHGQIPQLSIIMTLSSGEAIRAVLRQGIGISCLSQHVIQQDLQNGSLIKLNVNLALQRQYSWLTPPQRLDSPLLAAWLALIASSDSP